MKPLEILKANNIQLPPFLGKEIGSGIDGQVFEKDNDPSRVIKISISENSDYPCSYVLESKNYWHFARVYSCDCLYTSDKDGKPLLSVHCIEMEKLFPLTEDEEKLFHTLLSHEDANKQKEYTRDQLSTLIEELSEWFSFDKEEALSFCCAIMNCPIRHKDLHQRNIMKNVTSRFRLIDFDRLEKI